MIIVTALREFIPQLVQLENSSGQPGLIAGEGENRMLQGSTSSRTCSKRCDASLHLKIPVCSCDTDQARDPDGDCCHSRDHPARGRPRHRSGSQERSVALAMCSRSVGIVEPRRLRPEEPHYFHKISTDAEPSCGALPSQRDIPGTGCRSEQVASRLAGTDRDPSPP